MVKCQAVMQAMERIAPRRLAEEWDNPGLLVGSPADEVRRILVALDVREETIDRAIKDGCDMIVSHHPLIFRGLKAVRTDEATGHKIARLLRHGIAVFAAHTNLDSAEGGVNDVLAERLGLAELGALMPGPEGETQGLGRIGTLAAPQPLSLDAFAEIVKQRLGLSAVCVVRAGRRSVHRVALCGGSGASFIDRAATLGADVYVTGDVKYHDGEHAVDRGIHVVDAGHFATEHLIVERLAEALAAQLGSSVEMFADTKSSDFFQIL